MLQILTCRADLARRYGIDAAVLLHNLVYWTLKNKAEGRHFHDGRYWTYASRKGLAEMYPLWSEGQIRRLLARLRDSGALLTGDFNQDRRLRTTWYSPSDEILAAYGEEGIGQIQPVHCPESSGASVENGQCIYNVYKKRQQEKPPVVPQGTDGRFEDFWAAYPKKKGKDAARRAWTKLSPDEALYRVMARALDRQRASGDWRRENGRFVPYPATWLNGRRWEDEDDAPVRAEGGDLPEW